MPMIIPAVAAAGGTAGTFYATSNTTQGSSGTLALSSILFNGAGVASVGFSNGSVVVSVPAGGGGVTPALSGSNGSFSFSTATFGNLNGLSFYTSNGSLVGSHNGLTTAALSNHSHGNPTLNLTNLSGTTASNSAGFTLSLSANATFTPALSGSNGSFTYSTATFGNLNGLSFYTSNGSLVGSHNGLTTAALSDHSHGNPTLNLTNLSGTTASNSAGFTLSLSAAAPGGGAAVTLSRFEVKPLDTGTGASDHASGSWWFNPFVLPAALTFSNVMVLKSFSLSAPAGTTTASSGTQQHTYTHGITILRRVNWSNSSTQMTTVTTGSFGLSASISWTSGSQSMTFNWVTNSTGGTSSFSSTSNASNLYLFMQSNRFIAIPMVSSLSAGEYFIAHRHRLSNTTGGAGSAGFGISNIHIAPQSVTFKRLGISIAGQSSSSNPVAGIGLGIASTVETTTTFAASIISAVTQNYWYANFVNLPMET